MSKLFVDLQTEINASLRRVWDVFTSRDGSRHWVHYFGMEKGYLESTWKLGSPVEWKDMNGVTRVEGKVTRIDPSRLVHFTVRDRTDTASPPPSDEDGITLTFHELGAKTTVHVRQGDFGKNPDWVQYHEPTVRIWEKALATIKAHCES